MKTIINALVFVLAFSTANAQHQLATFDAPVVIYLSNDTISGVPLIRKAEFECLNYNRRSQSLSLQWRVTHYTTDSVAFPIIPEKVVECIADKHSYVLPDGSYIGGIDRVRQWYGTQSQEGEWSYTVQGIMTEYEFFCYISTLPVAITDAVRNNALSNLKLNKRWPY